MGRVGNTIGHSPRHQPGLDLFVVDALSWPEDGGDEAEDPDEAEGGALHEVRRAPGPCV